MRRGQVFDELRDRKNSVVGFNGQLSSGKVAQHQIGLGETNIDGDDQAIVGSDMKKGWLASARCLAGGAFVDQPLGDQFLHQHAHHPTGHVHAARQIGA